MYILILHHIRAVSFPRNQKANLSSEEAIAETNTLCHNAVNSSKGNALEIGLFVWVVLI